MSESQEINLQNELQEIIITKNVAKARDFIDNNPMADVAALLNELKLEEQLTFLPLLKTVEAAELFSYLDEEVQSNLAQSFTEDWGMKLLQELQSDELADVLEELPSNVTSKILAYTPREKRTELNKLLSYEDDEVGSIMSIDISSISNFYTCEQALHKIRRDYKKKNAELVHYYYVVNETNKLIGVLTLEEIIFADPNAKIDDIYNPVTYVSVHDKTEIAAQVFSEHDMSVLPVVNHEKRLVGMITSDDVIDVIKEEATEDLYKIAGINSHEVNENEYLKTPWYKILKSRILWLILLLLFATVTQIIVHFGAWSIAKRINQQATTISLATIAFAALIPVINSTTSNSGIQANISVNRALALKEIETNQYAKVIWKETLIGFISGLILALINFARLGVYFSVTKDLMSVQKMIYWAIIIGSSIALLLSLTISKLLGAAFPIIWAKFKKDPSSISVSLIKTITDIIATLLIFSLTFALITAFV
ncbi:magnesium transporter [Mycoplasmopsis caviae]|uniref:Magnesium transporter MgtE n=1 Tax=Mycoplasmopsis caviae TaxID=55603 RepID=A0A3P8KAN4_9BACT|nr:magnesium transporter [Mycoplasmopsis caviae]UUD34744.1 magnesium transporter [Mycoplasmopsis caviae]VDR42439.1 Magnesium transporter mgtE [Mycoplasmopsis caviae]